MLIFTPGVLITSHTGVKHHYRDNSNTVVIIINTGIGLALILLARRARSYAGPKRKLSVSPRAYVGYSDLFNKLVFLKGGNWKNQGAA